MKICISHLFIVVALLLVFGSCKKSSMEATKMLITGPNKEMVEGLKQKAKRDSINRTPEQKGAIKKQQEENARIGEMRRVAIEQMRAEGIETAKYYDDELESESGWELSYNMGLVFVALVMCGFIFLFWWFVIRNIRNNIRDISYVKNETQNKFDQFVNDPDFYDMTDEQRETVEKMKKYLDLNVAKN